MNKDLLCRPFPAEAIRQRPGQHGKTLSYVETHAVISRLNEGCESWSFEIVRHEVLADEVIVVGKLTADGVIKMSFGGSNITKDNTGREVSLADDLKAAASDGLKKAASLLGVGLELYGGVAHVPNNPELAAGRAGGSRVAEPDDRLTSRQLSAIMAVTRRRRMSTAILTQCLQDRFGKDAPQLLTKREAGLLLDELNVPFNGNGAAAE